MSSHNGRVKTLPENIQITPTAPKTPHLDASSFQHPLMVKQSSVWSRGILWTLMLVSTVTVFWASVAKIEEAVPAQGKLEPQDNVNEVQIPIEGVVKIIHVKDGNKVKAGDLLVSLDPTVSQAQENYLQTVRTALEQENQFYQAQLSGNEDTFPTVSIPTQFLSLTRSRAVLIAENRMFQAQMDGNTESMTLTAQQQQRVTSELEELTSRVTGAELEIEQLQKQYSQADIRLAANEKKLVVNEKILQDISELAEEGGISRIQFLNQQQEVDSIRAEIAQLQEEKIRLQAAQAQAQAKVQNTKAIDRRDLTTRIGNNSQRIAEIDSQLTKAVIDNKKRIAEIDSQLSQTNQALRYSVVRSPVDGVVFDLKANAPGFVAKSTEPVLKIVPQTDLVAKVSITNKDIGFIREGMHVDVRIDSFPYSEFGDIKGTLTWIGSDTLPPTQLQPYYTFPATVTLDQQYLNSKGRKIPLQSGMSLNGNIKIRERTVMSIFTDFFSKTGESLKFVR
ncbi:HlyD family efflux transporter periplasmic adaptor subunit [Nodularia sphaerocarpa]|uniref:HlyD family efflux transporter periplasmic adaptor subunit n=3 Tax=Nodularia sphaerocarpa TaxID=137816 RepID=UPI001EFB2C92|nr:HlyD family efflux transporter periplasmic adaptor subunit [Nodularia sphaerocarpa]MDB9374146.1 HlyD family efflux transporter periplasmic adaptor subunit [Nodularia sphaerocarpa CS-585]ULP71216.1 Leukotoxin export protein LtxD [Nodularia sphaerocarpa UHCC 0038]